jgi:glycerol transport system ATP-binding protein
MTIELKNISKVVGAETYIRPTNLIMESGEFNVLLGATNAGKSSLIKLMAGLDTPTAGEIWLNGKEVTKLSPQKRNVSLVHQFFINYPNMTVYDNIASPLKVAKLSKSEIAKKVQEAAEILQLEPMLHRHPHELSGGQQQRTALARAIVKDSDIILLDEPLANLDYKLREELRDQLPSLFSDRGTIVVYATSEPSEALLLGGKTATIFEGSVTQFGDTTSVYHHPNSLSTAQVFSDPPINVASVSKVGDQINLTGDIHWPIPDVLKNHPDGEYAVAIHPHFITPIRQHDRQQEITGTIKITELSGSQSVAHFVIERDQELLADNLANGQELTWVSNATGTHLYRLNESHIFYMDVERCQYFDREGLAIMANASDGSEVLADSEVNHG